MHKSIGLIAALLCLSLAPLARARADEHAPAPAKALLQSAMQKAKKEHKPLLVMFHASW